MSILLAIGAGAVASSLVLFAGKKKTVDINESLRFYATYTFDRKGNIISIKKNNSEDEFFLYEKKIKYNDDIQLLARMIFAEGGGLDFIEKIYIGEVARNRVNDKVQNSEEYCWNRYFAKYNTLYDVLTKTGFDGVKGKRFNSKDYLKFPIEKKAYIECVRASIIVLVDLSNISSNSLYFNLGGENPCSKSFVKTNKNYNFKHSFYAPIK